MCFPYLNKNKYDFNYEYDIIEEVILEESQECTLSVMDFQAYLDLTKES